VREWATRAFGPALPRRHWPRHRRSHAHGRHAAAALSPPITGRPPRTAGGPRQPRTRRRGAPSLGGPRGGGPRRQRPRASRPLEAPAVVSVALVGAATPRRRRWRCHPHPHAQTQTLSPPLPPRGVARLADASAAAAAARVAGRPWRRGRRSAAHSAPPSALSDVCRTTPLPLRGGALMTLWQTATINK